MMAIGLWVYFSKKKALHRGAELQHRKVYIHGNLCYSVMKL